MFGFVARTPIASDGRNLTDHETFDIWMGCFAVGRICAVISNLRISENYDLSAIGGISEDFLIPGDCGVEYHLACFLYRRTKTRALEDASILQRENCLIQLDGLLRIWNAAADVQIDQKGLITLFDHVLPKKTKRAPCVGARRGEMEQSRLAPATATTATTKAAGMATAKSTCMACITTACSAESTGRANSAGITTHAADVSASGVSASDVPISATCIAAIAVAAISVVAVAIRIIASKSIT